VLKHQLVFIGTYTEPILFGTGKIFQGKGEGIYAYRFDESSRSMNLCSVTQAGPNPSYLTFDPSHRFLYCVNELKEFEGAPTGAVSAFSINSERGTLSLLNRQPSHGTDPCNLIVDKSGRYVIVANFGSGSVCVLPIQKDGSLGDPSDVIQHHGSSIDPIRQIGPHAHGVTLDDSGLYVFVPDLGLDKLMVYKFDPDRGKLEPNETPWINIPASAGPRQLVFHPKGRYAYLINELNSTVMAFQYDGVHGSLRKLQILSTLPEEFKGNSSCGELQISPSGKFLYGSNRGNDSIAIYSINHMDGMLSNIGFASVEGKTPRHFIVDQEGEYLLVANQDTDSVVAFSLDSESGGIKVTGNNTNVPTPACVKIL